MKQLTYLLTPWSRVLLEKLTGSQIGKILVFPAFYGTRSFISAFTIAHQMLYSEPDRLSPCTNVPFPEDHLNIILPFTPAPSKWSLSIRYPLQNPELMT